MMKSVLRRIWTYLGGAKGLILIIYSVFVLLTSILLSDHYSKTYLFVCLPIIILLTCIICPLLLRKLSRIHIVQSEYNYTNRRRLVLKISMYVIPFIILMVYYVAYYPGGFSPDSITQYQQVISNEYSDWHPVIQTLFSFKLPLFLTGGWVGSIVLFQIICLTMVMGNSFNVVYEQTNGRFAFVSMWLVILNPQLCYLALYPWKDISFGMGAMLLSTLAFRIYQTKGEWLKHKTNVVVFVIVASLTTLFRHNAILFSLPLILFVLVRIPKRKGIIILLSIVCICWGIKVPMYSLMNVKPAGARQIETLGLPMTIIGGAVTYTPGVLDEDILEFAYKIAPKSVWAETYLNGSYNHVKADARTNNDVIEEYGAGRVISMMMRCISNTKMVSARSFIKLTNAFYSLTGEHNALLKPSIQPNELGIIENGNNGLIEMLDCYTYFASSGFPHLFMYLGVVHYLIIASILARYKLNSIESWKQILFVIPVLIYNAGTTLLLASYYDTTRFFFYSYLLMPILLVFMYKKGDIIEEVVE